MKRLLPLIPLVVCGLMVLLFAGYGLHHDPHVYPKALVGKPAPTMALAPLQGGEPESAPAALKGPGVINVFQSTCAPCAEEAPQLKSLKDSGVALVGVDWRDQAVGAQGFLDRFGNPFDAVLQDPKGDAGVEFGISGVPETFVIDAKGMVVQKYVGPLSAQDVQDVTRQVAQLQSQHAS
jgi:cytochrome c biogenesis protein CcmG/thiol:disulfide interchange protein DsbE